MLNFKKILDEFILNLKDFAKKAVGSMANLKNKSVLFFENFEIKSLIPHIPLIVCIILMIILIVISGGFANEVKVNYESEKNNNSNNYVQMTEINYLKQNCIVTEIQSIVNNTDNPPENGLYNKIVVSGLTDAAIQDKINQTIVAKYHELYDRLIPEYRGMDAVIDFSSKKQSERITMNVMGNFNDILSILIKKDVTQSNVFYSDCETLNFDLKTGELIKLKDLFQKDNCEFLNQYIANQIKLLGNRYSGGKVFDVNNDYLMISAFKGIRDDQKFYLCDNKLVVLIDYTNQEFYETNYKPWNISIGYDEIADYIDLKCFIVPTQTNEDGSISGLYSDNRAKYMLIYDNDDMKNVDAYEPPGKDNLIFSVNCSYPESMPQVLKDKAGHMCLIDDGIVNTLRNVANSNTALQFKYINNIRGYKIGGYYCIVRSSSSFKANRQSDNSESFVFDKDGNQLYIDKMFKNGFDYQSVITASIEEKLKSDFPDGNYGGKSLSEIYSGISFGLDSYGMQIKTQPIKFTSDQDDSEYESSVSVFIPYEKFGCDQMTIFN